MEAHTLHTDTAPGWRELLEALYSQIEDARNREQAALERERLLARLLDEERRELARLRGATTPPRAPAPPRERSTLHSKILEVVADQADGMTRAQIEAAVGTSALADVLTGLCRRGHLRRVSPGVYALPSQAG